MSAIALIFNEISTNYEILMLGSTDIGLYNFILDYTKQNYLIFLY